MKLKYAQIENFRSIPSIQVNFIPSCRVLVGINESGKTNILDALHYLDPEQIPSKKSIRQTDTEEGAIKNSFVRFVFELERDDLDYLISSLFENFHGVEDNKMVIVNKNTKKKMTLNKFLSRRNEALYTANFISETSYAGTWMDSDASNYTPPEYWRKPKANCPVNIKITISEGVTKSLNSFSIIHKDSIPEELQTYLEPISSIDITNLMSKEIRAYVDDALPQVLYWNYNPENLLPPKVNLKEFLANPFICAPLKCMFNLAGIYKIKEEIESSINSSTNGLRNLLRKVANQTTKHFQSVWKDYKSIEFELIPDGDNISISIKEINSYELALRSDGFKRFLTFLLLVSARVKTNQIENALLIIDEPDIGLHPSGAEYLRNELINISKNNSVVYSTHSIFMIDGDNISRHLIVKKEKERTSIKNADESNITEEEVIYNALGYSIFQNLHKKNIIFEGWRDKILYRIAMKSIPASYSSLRKTFKDIGICHGDGVKSMMNFTPILELAKRECFIFSDSDDMAKEKQKNYRELKGYGNWMRYDELLPGIPAITGEDFIIASAFSPILATLRERYPYLPLLSDTQLEGTDGKIEILKRWLNTNGFSKDKTKELINEIKEWVFNNLKPTEIKSSYYDLLVKLGKAL